MLPARVNLSEFDEGLAPRNSKVAATSCFVFAQTAVHAGCFHGLHPVCFLLQLQLATLAHAAFGKFVDSFLTDEAPVESGKLADKMVGAIAIH